jgi:hypothetical protein
VERRLEGPDTLLIHMQQLTYPQRLHAAILSSTSALPLAPMLHLFVERAPPQPATSAISILKNILLVGALVVICYYQHRAADD